MLTLCDAVLILGATEASRCISKYHFSSFGFLLSAELWLSTAGHLECYFGSLLWFMYPEEQMSLLVSTNNVTQLNLRFSLKTAETL